ncbi:hypothetical protein K491DRAFT_782758 [Lophiostoma macrostomum CBS 122681]|uniref:Tachykinin family protein n=1 Tax=Lophiostoma macrostomum CBS 122681 TaxID=1314788 RepID=A0A6A6SUH6_9PLEO|nr:hypothetical protein K491DRAFT_782758 [Lophiostoma macrostomum CBS 122681]
MDESTKQNFTFINLSHPDDLKDPNTIDQVRTSAMTNFGRKRRKPKAAKEKNQMVFEMRTPEAVAAEPAALSSYGPEILSLGPFLEGWNLDPRTRQLLENESAMNIGHSLALRLAWARVAFHDELPFQIVLANATLFESMVQAGRLLTEDTPESLELHNKALNMMHQRLNDPAQHTSDDVLGTIAGFLTHDWIIGDFVGWNKHMDALLEMIRLRGGMESLTEDLHLTLSGADLFGSFAQDTPPHLPLPAAWYQAVPSLHADPSTIVLVNRIAIIWKQELPHTLSWITTLDICLNLLADKNKAWNSWMDPMLHRLLSLRPLRADVPPTREAIMEEVCRIGSLLALAPRWRTFGIHPVRTDKLRQHLLLLLQTQFAIWGELRCLLLWTLMHATREADNEAETSEFGIRMAMVMGKMGVQGWKHEVKVLREILNCDWSDDKYWVWDNVVEFVENLEQMKEVQQGGPSERGL